jgi:hypothetical protein
VTSGLALRSFDGPFLLAPLLLSGVGVDGGAYTSGEKSTHEGFKF